MTNNTQHLSNSVTHSETQNITIDSKTYSAGDEFKIGKENLNVNVHNEHFYALPPKANDYGNLRSLEAQQQMKAKKQERQEILDSFN